MQHEPPERPCVPVACVGCWRPFAGDTKRTCLCPSCEAFRDRKEAERLRRELEEAAATWAGGRSVRNGADNAVAVDDEPAADWFAEAWRREEERAATASVPAPFHPPGGRMSIA